MIKNIKPNNEPKKGQNFFYSQEKIPKIMLQKGEEAFREMVNILYNMDPLPKFTYSKELAIKVPEGIKEWNNKDKITDLVNKKKEELEGEYQSFNFHYDMGTSLPQVSAALQLVDDNIGFSGLRRNNILSDHKYVGVGYAKDKTKYCFYFLFADQNLLLIN